ncbi:hypothetical protein HYC85_028600 [Camellia sinensis]|uniref:Uncharacterized protein n=1 Tax=Camellia sinensis TaxID=4442 RepID=A0A7J7FVV7_CAMSI|nr:hypothetical protein HYC85_028600 [Camellia sinensis]
MHLLLGTNLVGIGSACFDALCTSLPVRIYQFTPPPTISTSTHFTYHLHYTTPTTQTLSYIMPL